MPPLRRNDIRQAVSYAALQQVKDLLYAQPWRFAKTMPDNPHWYTLRKTWLSDEEFIHCVQFIRAHGYREKYANSWYTVLNINDMKYWTMGAPLEQTILINRKQIAIDYPPAYDAVADIYDDLFSDAESERENQEVFAMLAGTVGRVLDVACGTGLLLDGLPIAPADYSGLDPSARMQARFCEKRPDYTDCLTVSCFEDYANGQYDNIICLFGSMSYVPPVYLARVEQMLKPAGRYFLMFYRPGYQPITHLKTGINPPFYQGGWEHLPGSTVTEYHNFIIARGKA